MSQLLLRSDRVLVIADGAENALGHQLSANHRTQDAVLNGHFLKATHYRGLTLQLLAEQFTRLSIESQTLGGRKGSNQGTVTAGGGSFQ